MKHAETLRRNRVRQLFQHLAPDQRTEGEILAFYGWLKQHHPELLPVPSCGRDPYQHLKVGLTGLYKPS
jgi:hypothetical protein